MSVPTTPTTSAVASERELARKEQFHRILVARRFGGARGQGIAQTLLYLSRATDQFRSLRSLDTPTKRELRRAFRANHKELLVHKEVMARVTWWPMVVGMSLIILVTLFGPLALSLVTGEQMSLPAALISPVLYVTLVSLLLLLLVRTDFSLVSMLLVTAVSWVWVLGVAVGRIDPSWAFYSVTTLSLFVVELCVLIGVGLVIFGTQSALTRSGRTEAIVVRALFEALRAVEATTENGTNSSLRSRAEAMKAVERAALSLEQDLPRCLKTRDPVTDDWFRHCALEMAETVRAEKRSLLGVPAEQSHVPDRLASAFTLALRGNWLELPRTELSLSTRRERRMRKALRIAGRVAIGATPLIVVAVLQQTPAALHGNAREYAVLAVVGWLLVTLAQSTDAKFGEKVSTMKDVMSFLPGPSKS